MNAKHTPGPWKSQENDTTGNTTTVFAVNGSCNLHISEVSGSMQERNARLIAAAPDLLDALQAIRNSPYWDNLSPAKQDIARAAIAKATGD